MKQIPETVLNVLDAATKEGNRLVLTGQLDRSLYTAANKVIEAAGGKWSRKDKAHVFEGDAADAIEQIILTGVVDRKQDLGQFDTPLAVAHIIMRFAAIKPGDYVLEPSAGVGRLVAEASNRGAIVDCYEIDPARVAKLRDLADTFATASHVACADFLTVTPKRVYDRVVMNPPFAKQADIDHVLHAAKFVKEGGKLIAVMAAGVMFRQNAKTMRFKEWLNERTWFIEPLPEGSFKGSGTGVNTCLLYVDL